jgi:hypothetical protein
LSLPEHCFLHAYSSFKRKNEIFRSAKEILSTVASNNHLLAKIDQWEASEDVKMSPDWSMYVHICGGKVMNRWAGDE